MRPSIILPLAASCLMVGIHASAAVRPHHRSSTHAVVRRSTATHVSHAAHVVEHSSSVTISPERATEIQTALIQKGYLGGDPTGTWDASTISALEKLQSDNGWQTKFVPDSRALFKLGLGGGPTTTPGETNPPSPATSATVTQPGQTF